MLVRSTSVHARADLCRLEKQAPQKRKPVLQKELAKVQAAARKKAKDLTTGILPRCVEGVKSLATIAAQRAQLQVRSASPKGALRECALLMCSAAYALVAHHLRPLSTPSVVRCRTDTIACSSRLRTA